MRDVSPRTRDDLLSDDLDQTHDLVVRRARSGTMKIIRRCPLRPSAHLTAHTLSALLPMAIPLFSMSSFE
jgi:hypothetical protein